VAGHTQYQGDWRAGLIMVLPGWDSIGATTILSNIFELSGIALFLIVIAFEFLAYLYARRKDQLVERTVRSFTIERQQQHESELAELRRRLSEADKRASESESKNAKRRPSTDRV
jgi:hypothetical protein